MNYLIVPIDSAPFYTNWFTAENNFVDGMIVFNLLNGTHTKDGVMWPITQTDNL